MANQLSDQELLLQQLQGGAAAVQSQEAYFPGQQGYPTTGCDPGFYGGGMARPRFSFRSTGQMTVTRDNGAPSIMVRTGLFLLRHKPLATVGGLVVGVYFLMPLFGFSVLRLAGGQVDPASIDATSVEGKATKAAALTVNVASPVAGAVKNGAVGAAVGAYQGLQPAVQGAQVEVVRAAEGMVPQGVLVESVTPVPTPGDPAIPTASADVVEITSWGESQ